MVSQEFQKIWDAVKSGSSKEHIKQGLILFMGATKNLPDSTPELIEKSKNISLFIDELDSPEKEGISKLPENEKNIIRKKLESRRQASQRLLRDIGKGIVWKLEGIENVNQLVLIAGSDDNEIYYGISRDEWLEIIKAVIEEIDRNQGGKPIPMNYTELTGIMSSSNEVKGFYTVLEINKNLLGAENLELCKKYCSSQ